MKLDVFVTVVAALNNDADVVEEFLEEVHDVVSKRYRSYEVIIVDDGSFDGSEELLIAAKKSYPCFRFVRLTRSFGVEAAISCGLEMAIGDIVVVLDPARDPVERIPEFVALAQGHSGIVIGVEDRKRSRNIFYQIGYNLHYFVSRVLLERPQIRGASHFMALSRTALNALLRIRDNFRYVRVLAMYAGFEVATVPYAVKDRRDKPRRRPVISLIDEGVTLIVSNTVRPLRIVVALSVIAAVTNFVYIFYVLAVKYLLHGIAPGWASTAFQNSLMFGVLFLVLAVMGEYLARLLMEVKRRPLYVIQEEFHSDVMLIDSEVRNVVLSEQSADLIIDETSDR